MNVDLELYRVFCEVVKYKNITKTAENIHISQSAITQSIQKLENLLGGKIFYRNKSGVELTDEGKKLYDYIVNSIETMSNAENVFSQYTNLENGRVRIGGGDTQVQKLLVEPIDKFTKKYPNIGIYITPGRTEELIQKLSNGELDVVTIRDKIDYKKYVNIEFIPLKRSTYCFFATPKFIKENKIKTYKDIEKNNVIVPKRGTAKNDVFIECCKKNKINLDYKYEVATSLLVKEFVKRNMGIGFIDVDNLKDIKDKIVIMKKFEVDEFDGVAIRDKKMCNRATIEFMKYVKKYHKAE